MYLRLVCSAIALVALTVGRLSAQEPNFSRDVLPILSNHCFQCHGPDAKARKAELRLDTADGALRADEPVIVPGKSSDSELVRRIAHGDTKKRMPPPQANKPLSAAQIDILKRWIDAGAKWGRHWAFEPPRRPPLPAVRNAAWVRNPIDHFVLARLEAEKM